MPLPVDAAVDAGGHGDAGADVAVAVDMEADMAVRVDEVSPPRKEQEIVAVGTISHVLRRAFHRFYETDAEHASSHEDEDTVTGVRYEAEAEAADDRAGTEEGGADTQVAATSADEKAQGSNEGNETTNGGDHSPAKTMDTTNNAFVRMGAARRAEIEKDLRAQKETASALLQYLEQCHAEAHAADAETAAQLSRQGLVIKAQLPMGPSPLRLDARELKDRFGDALTSTMVHASELVAAFHADRLEKSGNGPHSRARVAAAGIHKELPGYLTTTSAYEIRKETTLTAHRTQIETVKSAEHDKRLQQTQQSNTDSGANMTDTVTSSEDNDHGATHKAAMSAPERRKNMAILERMQTKLDFARNPRHATPLTKDKEASAVFIASPAKLLFHEYDVGGVYEQVVEICNTSPLSRRLRVLPTGTLHFSIAQVVFPDASGLVAPGMHVSVTVQFAPDSRADFQDQLVIPFESEGGIAAVDPLIVALLAHREPPQLSLPLEVRAQYTLVGSQSTTSFMCVNTGGRGRFWLLSELDWAQWERASIQDANQNKQDSQARGSNTLGAATTAAAAAIAEWEMEPTSKQGSDATTVMPWPPLRVGPFALTPTALKLERGDRATLLLRFRPSCVGEQRAAFVMVCDNCVVRRFQLVGRGCQVELSVSALNERGIEQGMPQMGPLERIQFTKPLYVYATASQNVTVRNNTPIVLRFSWRFEQDTTYSSHTTKAIKIKKLAKRNKKAKTTCEAVVACPFAITPAHGELAPSAAASFTVLFAPEIPEAFAWRIVLELHDVPLCSVPGPQQLALLQDAFANENSEMMELDTDKANASRLACGVHSLSLLLRGSAQLGAFHLDPQMLILPLTLCQSSKERDRNDDGGVVELVNDSDAPMRFQWDLLRVIPSQSPIELQLSPVAGELPPHGRQTITIKVSPSSNPGNGGDVFSSLNTRLSLSVPCVIPSPKPGFIVERWLSVQVQIPRPRVEIIEPEVDFGLVLVSARAKATISLRNVSTMARAYWATAVLNASGTPIAPTSQQPQLTRTQSSESCCSSAGSVGFPGLRGGNDSGCSTARSENDTDGEGDGALCSPRSVPVRAHVTMLPSSGALEPGQTVTVSVACVAGRAPERFRTRIACFVFAEPPRSDILASVHEEAAVAQEFSLVVASARAEIQAPNVYLTPLQLALGTTYVGVPVTRIVTLVNVSNLEAGFVFREPQGPQSSHCVSFSPRQGVLYSKQTLNVQVTYTAQQPVGQLTALLSCSVNGLLGPLGLELTTFQRGLVLTYEVLERPPTLLSEAPLDSTPVSLPVHMEPGSEPDEPRLTHPKLEFGSSIPLGKRCGLTLRIRNYSGIHAQLDLAPQQFIAAALDGLATHSGSTTSGCSSSLASSNSHRKSSMTRRNSVFTPDSVHTNNRLQPVSLASSSSPSAKFAITAPSSRGGHGSIPLLSDALEPTCRFQSEPGRAFLQAQREQEEARSRLRYGLGIAFLVEPSSLRLSPWEQRDVTVTCFSDLPGCYSDVLLVNSNSGDGKAIVLPLCATIVGSPLAWDRQCVGLRFPRHQLQAQTKDKELEPGSATNLDAQDDSNQNASSSPTLSFGDLCVRAPIVNKTLRIVNRGPRAARITWKLAIPGREHRVVDVTLRVDFAARVQLRIQPCRNGTESSRVKRRQRSRPGAANKRVDDSSSSSSDDDDTPMPFALDAPRLRVPAFGTAVCTVRFTPAAHAMAARMVMLGDARWLMNTEQDMASGNIYIQDGLEVDQRREPGSVSAAGPALRAVRAANATTKRSPREPTQTNPDLGQDYDLNKGGGVERNLDLIPSREEDSSTSLYPDDTNDNAPPKDVSIGTQNRGKTQSLRVLLAANVVEPELVLDQRARSTPSDCHVQFTTWTTLAADSTPCNHAFHRKELYLVNRMQARATFRLEATGPFRIAAADSLAPVHPLAGPARPGRLKAPTASTGSGGDTGSLLFALPPGLSVRVDLRFDPSKALADVQSRMQAAQIQNQTQAHTGSRNRVRPELTTHVDGELLVRFTNQSVQHLVLRGELQAPMLVVSPAVYSFGGVHLSVSRRVVLRLANPTRVPARFHVRHVPRPRPVSRAQQQEMDTHHAQYVDEPAVFTFVATSGVVLGPTLSLAAAGGAQPRTHSDPRSRTLNNATAKEAASRLDPSGGEPADRVHAASELEVIFQAHEVARSYRSRFRLVVEHGVDCELVLEGHGHLSEADTESEAEARHPTRRALRPAHELRHSNVIFRPVK